MTPLRPEIPGLQPVTLIQALLPAAGSGDQASQTAQWASQLQLGQRIIAEVQAHLADGSFLVKIDNTTTRMNLPAATVAGEKITLTVVDKTPLPAFILNASSPASSDSSSMSLSPAGKLIAAILQQPNESVSAPITGKTPVIPQAGAPAPQLANALQQTLSQSGLFYESHLNQWINGQRTITQLMQEPQANQKVQISVAPSPVNAATATVAGPASAAALAHTPAAAAPSSPLPVGPAINNPSLAQLVHQQLHALEQNRFLWQGELWPGQAMEWEVSDDTPRDSISKIQSVWSSKVSFELPQLGKVIAHLKLNGEQLTMQLQAETSAAMAQLQAHSNRLSTVLGAAGIPLAAFHVKTHA
ncbi:MAG TPA: flagellar hook-length control protein FliK [Burkholderiales bacterium]|nr:flagellar hook-length control protein FliK [Burkholderiales bacterium]